MSNSTLKKRKRKPAKPYPEFPLFAHSNGQWVKKVRGKLYYFGPWSAPQAALDKYLEQKDDLHAGRTPREHSDGLTLRSLCNSFLTSKQHQLDTEEITQRTFNDYHRVCKRVIDYFGKNRLVSDLRPVDFEGFRGDIAASYGKVALGNEVTRIKTIFHFAFNAGLVETPIVFGPTFRRPPQKVLRKERRQKGPRMFQADQIRALLDAAGIPLKAMILLAANAGFGNADCGLLPLSAVDLDNGWIDFPRPKTEVPRKCKLWPETIKAMRQALETRPNPTERDAKDKFFVTSQGSSWYKEKAENPVSVSTRRLLDKLGIRRPGIGFYALRHGFETIAGETTDQVAVDHIMGHSRNDMASVYREGISDQRLVKVADFVHGWLFPPEEAQETE